MVFLSFNSAITAPDDVAELHGEDQDDGGMPDGLALRFTWVVWQQRAASKTVPYEQATKQLATMASVEDFWQTWEVLPQPSELLTRRMASKTSDAEDAANSGGGHFQFHFKTSMGGAQIDEYWNNVVLGTLGNTLEPADMITGLRLVDKVTGLKAGVPSTIRIEVWFGSAQDQQAVAALQRNVECCLATRTLEGRLGNVPKAELKVHKLTRHQREKRPCQSSTQSRLMRTK
ncbi:Eukaryotic translation initiation factor NCBP (Novel cap-binding protein) (nCBP) (mRNA cap-binding protein) [Durusdinium trenchii]|uniref:Eukaryotic translation initiation factor NCBP (Novel cap-binding protein) (NCBP) (mRNA cap-binding protein) n=1 Tax=Durusdinium trenchii TaxID=1381693 RepID=A0ABP0H829_9DINO